MLISELIEELVKKKELHGDLPVYHWDDWDEFAVEEVNFIEEYSEDKEDYYIPKHILLGKDIHGFGKRMDGFEEFEKLQLRPNG